MTPITDKPVAVFSRNWLKYLVDAAKRGEAITVFQSHVRWVSARRSVASGPKRIYFAVIKEDDDDESTPIVEYEADLVEVRIDPKKRDEKWLLEHTLASTRKEGVWGKTLYAIANCKRIRQPFSITKLERALRPGVNLDSNYRRAYALVRERP